MPTTAYCIVCGMVRELSAFEQPSALCSDECQADFAEIVGELSAAAASVPRASGIGSEHTYWLRRLAPALERLGIDPRSRLASAAVDEVQRHWRAERVEAREWREYEYERNNRRKLKSLYPC